MKIFIVDDNALIRKAMTQFIEYQPNLKICGEADNAEEALKNLEQLLPDMGLIDISLGGNEKGIQLISDIRARGHTFPILTISLHEEGRYAEKARKAGAQGYLMKQDAAENIVRAIESVAAKSTEFFSVSASLLKE